MPLTPEIRTLGLVGFGAFGRLVAQHLAPHVALTVTDPALSGPHPLPPGARIGTPEQAAACDLVILAVPVAAMAQAIADIAPHLRPGTVVADVGSVKLATAKAMRDLLPQHADLVGTHPLFGPQSARDGLAGHRIAICNIRGRAHLRLAAFLKHVLGLTVIHATPEAHDREAAVVQGLTHLVARILTRMGPLPTRMTTASYELMMQAAGMVRDDPPGVFAAITRANPYAAEVRDAFLHQARALGAELDADAPARDGAQPGRVNLS